MSVFLHSAYTTGATSVLTKLALTTVPDLGYGEEGMLEDNDMPESLRRTELDSYLQRALTTDISPEEDFVSHGRNKGSLIGGLSGATVGGLAGAGVGSLVYGGTGRSKAIGALIGALGLGSAGALIGRPMGGKAGRNEHQENVDLQNSLGEIYTNPAQYEKELELHKANGRRSQLAESRAHDLSVAAMNRPPAVTYQYQDGPRYR